MRDRESIRLEIPNSSEYVSVARQTVEGIARRLSFSPDQIEDVKLAVGEACTNAVKHGAESNTRIVVRYTISSFGLEIEIRNAVHSNMPPAIAAIAPEPLGLNEGGLGLFLMKQLMDEVELLWEEGLATVKMIKRTPNCEVESRKEQG